MRQSSSKSPKTTGLPLGPLPMKRRKRADARFWEVVSGRT
jgi:hypothetical protein